METKHCEANVYLQLNAASAAAAAALLVNASLYSSDII